MPELPEVETTVRGISPYVAGATITEVVVRQPQLRWPVPANLSNLLVGKQIDRISRRAKYMLFSTTTGHILIHLGMSGSLRISQPNHPSEPHDHIEFGINHKWRLRYRDPRRFGCVLWVEGDPENHKLLANLGVEPISDEFDGAYLHRYSRGKTTSVKQFIMDGRIVVGVGNIYASEALFKSGIHPNRRAGRISLHRYELLAANIKSTLLDAIAAGGTTLRDFVSATGQPGYFHQELLAYDRKGEPCVNCNQPISRLVIGQRATYYCKRCQR